MTYRKLVDNYIPIKYKYTVYGYCKTIPFYIPPSLCCLCLHYYFQQDILRIDENQSAYFMLNKLKDTVSNGICEHYNAFGSNLIKCGSQFIYTWELKILRLSRDFVETEWGDLYPAIAIGLSTYADEKEVKYIDYGSLFCQAGIECTTYAFANDGKFKEAICSKNNTQKEICHLLNSYKEGDTVTLIVNMQEQTLDISINDIDQKLKQQIHDLNDYYLAIYIHGVTKVKILSYDQSIISKQIVNEKNIMNIDDDQMIDEAMKIKQSQNKTKCKKSIKKKEDKSKSQKSIKSKSKKTKKTKRKRRYIAIKNDDIGATQNLEEAIASANSSLKEMSLESNKKQRLK